MKNLVGLLLLIVLISSAFAADTTLNINVSLLKYTPFPAEPGNYVALTLRVENKGSEDANDVRLKFVPNHPFSLDNNSTVRIGNAATPLFVGNDNVVSLGKLPPAQSTIVEYKVRIAAGALEGNSQLQLWHQPRASDSWTIDTFTILIQGTDKLEVASVIPSTLTPGKPANVAFVLNNSGTASIRNIAFTWTEKDNKILSLGSGNKKYVESIGPGASTNISFTLIADPSAAPGVYTLTANMTYVIGGNVSKSLSVNVGMFVGGKGEFDVSVQETQAGTVSISIANVGSNPATSVSVRIPDQENFNVVGPPTSFVGDLDPGDFTLATFRLSSKSVNGRSPLKVEVAYTDTNSNRQTIEKEVTVNVQDLSSERGQINQRAGGLDLVILGILGVVIIIALIKYNARIRNMIRKSRK